MQDGCRTSYFQIPAYIPDAVADWSKHGKERSMFFVLCIESRWLIGPNMEIRSMFDIEDGTNLGARMTRTIVKRSNFFSLFFKDQ